MIESKEMRKALKLLEQAKKECLQATLSSIADLCKQHQIVATFGYLTVLKDREGKNVSEKIRKKIHDIEYWYCNNVHRTGFMGYTCDCGKWI